MAAQHSTSNTAGAGASEPQSGITGADHSSANLENQHTVQLVHAAGPSGQAVPSNLLPRTLPGLRGSVVLKVPLHADVDPSFLCTLTARDGTIGIRLDRFTYYTKGSSKILESITQHVQNAAQPLIHVGQDTKVYIDREFFPGEVSTRSDTNARVSKKTAPPDNYWTVGEVLARAVAKQRTWYDYDIERGRLRHIWENPADGSFWSEWGKHGLKESSIYVVALRRTIPTAKNIVYYFPELELRFV